MGRIVRYVFSMPFLLVGGVFLGMAGDEAHHLAVLCYGALLSLVGFLAWFLL
jgi:hypothetical protein